MNIIQAMINNKSVISMSEGRRMISQSVVKVNGVHCNDSKFELNEGDEVVIGKRKSFVVGDKSDNN